MTSFAENVAFNMAGTWSAAQDKVIDQWMNSEGHRANIMADNNLMAIGTYYKEAEREFYFTQLFAALG